MNKKKIDPKKYAFLLLLLFCSCGSPRIDERYAASIVKDNMALICHVTAEKLSGGLSGAQLFTVTAADKKYVVRFLTHKTPEKREREMRSLQVASDNGYGPHIYSMDEKNGVIVMEYLSGQPITHEMRCSDELYRMLGVLLRKMHSGPPLQKNTDVFDRRRLHEIQEVYGKAIPFATIETELTTIQKAVAPHITSAPCHIDLNPNNLIFLGNEFKAIDYETSAQANPNFDVATVSFFYCLHQHYDDVLLASYLGRQPTSSEKAQLYLMKQVAFINYALIFLKLAHKKIKATSLYQTLQVPSSYEAFLKEWPQEGGALDKPEFQLKYAKVLISQIIANASSQEFCDAIATLEKR
jgi:thiamine kinase-like enzyme